jgi:predicted dehydrogenase
MRSLIVGLGRSGAGLHLPVLRRLFPGSPVVGYDPADSQVDGLVRASSLAHAATLLDPGATVVHLCAPATHLPVLAELGFRDFLVASPLAEELLPLRRQHGLRLAVVAPWLASELTRRLTQLTSDGWLGAPRLLTVAQSRSRFRRSAATAFDVDLPHAVGVALRLAGDATVADASCADLVLDDVRLPDLGCARLRLRHAGGVQSRLESMLTSPVRERRITIRFEHGTATGHYPVDADDDHAQLTVVAGRERRHTVFRDDSLGAFLCEVYRRFAIPGDAGAADLDLAERVARLLTEARKLATAHRETRRAVL